MMSNTDITKEPAELEDFDSDEEVDDDERRDPKTIKDQYGKDGFHKSDVSESFQHNYGRLGLADTTVYESTRFAVLRLKGDGRSWRCFIAAFSLSTLFSTLFIVLFSSIPGVYNALIDFRSLEDLSIHYTFPICGAVAFGLFILDTQYSEIAWVRGLGYFIWFLCGLGILIATLTTVRRSPVAAYALYTFAFPLVAGYVKVNFFRMEAISWYLRGIVIPQIITVLVTFVAYPIYVSVTDNTWAKIQNDTDFLVSVGCDETNGTVTNCASAFIVYFSPIILGLISLANSTLIIVLNRHFRTVLKLANASIDDLQNMLQQENKANGEIQFFSLFVIMLLTSSYIATSLVRSDAAGLDFATVILGFSIVFVFVSIYASIAVLGTPFIRAELRKTAFGKIVDQMADSDWVKALILFFGIPVAFIIIFIGLIVQCVRKYTPLGKKLETEDEKNLLLSLEVTQLLSRTADWEWGWVLLKGMQIGVILFVVAVIVGRVTNIFLSWLSEVLLQLSLPLTTVIFVLVGLGMFLLPPVPGLPVYLAGGIVLTANAMSAGWNFYYAALYSCLIAYILKLLAIALQQKVIGQMYGRNSVGIRAAVNINSLDLRAMKLMLSKPGLTFPKMCILVGGPDWPTSVLTGILGLSLIQMLIGSLPVIVIVFPMGFSGAVLTLEDQDNVLLQYSPAMLTISLMIQGFALVLAVHYTKKTAEECIEEIEEKCPIDKEVEKYQEAKQATIERKKFETEWKNLDDKWKVGHCIFFFIMMVSIYTLQFFGNNCFEPFEVQNSINDDLDGNVLNVVTTFGWVALGLFSVAALYLYIFSKVISCRVKSQMKANKISNTVVTVSEQYSIPIPPKSSDLVNVELDA